MPRDPLPIRNLVLGRTKGEAVMVIIGNIRVRIVVTEVRGAQVRLGLDAPDCVVIHREEVHKQVEAKEAARAD